MIIIMIIIIINIIIIIIIIVVVVIVFVLIIIIIIICSGRFKEGYSGISSVNSPTPGHDGVQPVRSMISLEPKRMQLALYNTTPFVDDAYYPSYLT
jgi:hypothetical protein